ncbi:lipid droplet-associated perilipin protein [Macrolepiota fuliginosa MF-IS2]|uniref:Lipid droplet-associated perilipin protein n=1 Tax=Macrolepiota fuliginosa MF-IS2 TaxID=1400762 RepID=A0A9P5X9T6_9AGAR|nr:lipid droplet-associated perilipin protein [Macrolepiota fuliginosa MF-IS2]
MSAIETETAQAPPQLTILARVASIPLISSSLDTIDQTLSSNAYTRSLYPTAKGLSSSAYKYTEPIQIRLAPLITRADGFANKAVDVVEARCPYPFKVKPEEVTEFVRERRDSAAELVNHSIDGVKNPAVQAATNLDQRFAPIVDYLEVVIKRITNPDEPGPSAPDAKYQYQRALALTRDLYGYSNDQLKHLQAHSNILHRATTIAHSITDQGTPKMANAQDRVHQLSDTMLAELQKLQESTAAFSSSLQSTATSTVQSRIPPHVQSAFADLSHTLSTTISDFRSTITAKDTTLQEKVGRIIAEVRERIVPVLGSVTKVVGDTLHLNGPPPPTATNGEAESPVEGTQSKATASEADNKSENAGAQPSQNGDTGHPE